jgi:hypothetical protein
MLNVCCRMQSSAKSRLFYSAMVRGSRSISARPRARIHWAFAGSRDGLQSRTTRPPRIRAGGPALQLMSVRLFEVVWTRGRAGDSNLSVGWVVVGFWGMAE